LGPRSVGARKLESRGIIDANLTTSLGWGGKFKGKTGNSQFSSWKKRRKVNAYPGWREYLILPNRCGVGGRGKENSHRWLMTRKVGGCATVIKSGILRMWRTKWRSTGGTEEIVGFRELREEFNKNEVLLFSMNWERKTEREMNSSSKRDHESADWQGGGRLS